MENGFLFDGSRPFSYGQTASIPKGEFELETRLRSQCAFIFRICVDLWTSVPQS